LKSDTFLRGKRHRVIKREAPKNHNWKKTVNAESLLKL